MFLVREGGRWGRALGGARAEDGIYSRDKLSRGTIGQMGMMEGADRVGKE